MRQAIRRRAHGLYRPDWRAGWPKRVARRPPLPKVPVMWRRVPGLVLTAVLALAVLVVGHNLVFLLTYGPGSGVALIRTGHGSRWDETVRVVLSAESLLAATATLRLAYLCRLVRRLSPGFVGGGLSARGYIRALLPLWAGLFASSTLLFVLQENLEHWNAGLGLPGFSVLGSAAYVGPIPVFALVSLLVAAVTALFRWGVRSLEAQIVAGRTLNVPPASSPRRHFGPDPDRRATSILGRNLAGRAPPAPIPA
jgi:hypothetical protein